MCEWNAEQPTYETRIAITNAVFRDIAGGNAAVRHAQSHLTKPTLTDDPRQKNEMRFSDR
ncbi:MAG TPA: hypothetical protein VE944_12375 [Nostoc sp.]|nr:hypothetical protein [Nostoc sp.]